MIDIHQEYQYRFALRSDLQQLQDLTIRAYSQFKHALTPDNWQTMETNLQNVTTYTTLMEQATCIVCEKENVLVGTAFCVPSGKATPLFQADWSYIRLVGVHPQHEGKGIGKELTRKCIQIAKSAGEKTIALHTSEFQPAARHVYESLGFTVLKEIDAIFGKRYFIYTLQL
jgi:ribosomal protein S18 acetylase RimI-like enzyme